MACDWQERVVREWPLQYNSHDSHVQSFDLSRKEKQVQEEEVGNNLREEVGGGQPEVGSGGGGQPEGGSGGQPEDRGFAAGPNFV